MRPFKEKIFSLLRFLSNARLFAFVLLWLMIILVAGTIAEKTAGLYVAEQRYFSSFIIWLWDCVPVPGLLTVTAVIFAGLVARLALENWQWKNLGTIIIHIGAAMLLAGGFVTALVSQEGTMIIPQGQSRDYMEDARHVELAVSELQGDNIVSEIIVPEAQLATGDFPDALPFKLKMLSWCRNCGLVRLPQPVTSGAPHGVAINFILKDKPRAPEDEANRAGLTFRLQGTDSDGLYAIFQDMPIPEVVSAGGKKYWLAIRYVRYALPFAIQLQHFKEELYPGTNKPRAYQSDIIVQDHGLVWPSSIRMNEPLRYKGYTFYQSSFLQGNGTDTTTVLSVVKNAGRLFPYLSGLVIALGFITHLWQRLIWQKRRLVS